MTVRYAIYFAPDPASSLWRFGCGVIGYDAVSGVESAPLAPEGWSQEAWFAATREPRRYGFHATMKAPFALADGNSEAALLDAIRHFCARARSVPIGPCSVRPIGGVFAALIPDHPPPELAALESAIVSGFDSFRAPLTDADRARRRPDRLTPRQRDHLDRWGYPYVLDEFRFHMTLSGPLETAEAVAVSLDGTWRAAEPSRSVLVDRLALFRQDDGGPFRIVAAMPLGD